MQTLCVKNHSKMTQNKIQSPVDSIIRCIVNCEGEREWVWKEYVIQSQKVIFVIIYENGHDWNWQNARETKIATTVVQPEIEERTTFGRDSKIITKRISQNENTRGIGYWYVDICSNKKEKNTKWILPNSNIENPLIRFERIEKSAKSTIKRETARKLHSSCITVS